MDLWSVLMAMLGSPEKRWLLAVIVLLTINTGAILASYFDRQATLGQKLKNTAIFAVNLIPLQFAEKLADQDEPNLQQFWAVVWTGGLIGIVTLWHFLKPPKVEISARDRRSELLGVLKEEYGQRERDSVLGNSAAPVPLEPPRPIPFLGKLLGFGQERSLSGLDDLLTVFDQENRQVLILGEPGAGKTTLLVALANRLVQRAIEDDREPIPVILELSAWRAGESLTDWVVAEVAERYRPLPAAQVANWLTTRQLLPLLDGLDELKDRQGAVMVAINEWVLQSLKLAGVVVCCRREEYDAVVAAENVTLEERINKRIELQPLDEATIRAHLHDCERDFLWAEIQQDRAGFRKLAESPLLLDLMVAAYDKPGKWQLEPPRNPHDLETHYLDCRDRLLDDYFEARLHSVAHPKYKPADTRRYLEWLARSMRDRNQTEFLIEYMQPDLLGDRYSICQYHLAYGSIVGLLSWLIFGIFGVFFWVLIFWENIKQELISPAENLDFSFENLQKIFRKGIGRGLSASLMFILLVQPKPESIIWLIVAGLIIGINFELSLGLRGNQIRRYTYPNDGMSKELYNILIMVGILWPGCLTVWLILSSTQSDFRDFATALSFATAFSVMFTLYLAGGYVIIQHGCLRFLLEKRKAIPHNYRDFLIYTSDQLKLLKRSGGRFRFYHDLLRERVSN